MLDAKVKVYYVSWNDPETVFHEMLWKKKFTVYPSLKKKIVFCYLFCIQWIATVHSEPNQKSKMELFAKIVNGWKLLPTFTKRSILDVSLDSDCTAELYGNLLQSDVHSLSEIKGY